MFDQLTARLGRTLEALRGRGRITEDNIAAALREARMALLEADVALPVVKSFIEAVKTQALGAEVLASLTPGQAFIGILHQELVRLMGGAGVGLNLRVQPPAVILLAGLQGAGKTTSAAKLARWLIERERKRVLLVSTDVRRPAAMLQLETLAGQVGAEYFAADAQQAPVAIAQAALERARRAVLDVLIIDTAGRLHVDEALMAEVRAIDAAVPATERLFVVDAMAGQDAVNAARAFAQALALTGILLTKADGDARGGAALSVRQVTGAPILFLGVGEKTEALEPFDPARMASRILGMGDVVTLVEQVHRQVDAQEAARLTEKVVKGRGFDMLDLRGQLEQLQKMGGVGALMDKLPGAVKRGASSAEQGDRELRRQIAIINSMTPRERRHPGLIDGSRRRRIAAGSGVQVQDVNRLLKQFQEMQRVMKQMKGGGLRRLLGAFKGGLPPGFPPR
ncbi:MAG: signal recognition particle protein [Gammaproteobacteria bacterium]|nr:signal recognition particle protein [Gammaproteobacteria bacterium]MBV9620219.1 signal recognition particle protein [Gammaproteobacteria bacterium]